MSCHFRYGVSIRKIQVIEHVFLTVKVTEVFGLCPSSQELRLALPNGSTSVDSVLQLFHMRTEAYSASETLLVFKLGPHILLTISGAIIKICHLSESFKVTRCQFLCPLNAFLPSHDSSVLDFCFRVFLRKNLEYVTQ
jgi:hypothetical protein